MNTSLPWKPEQMVTCGKLKPLGSFEKLKFLLNQLLLSRKGQEILPTENSQSGTFHTLCSLINLFSFPNQIHKPLNPLDKRLSFCSKALARLDHNHWILSRMRYLLRPLWIKIADMTLERWTCISFTGSCIAHTSAVGLASFMRRRSPFALHEQRKVTVDLPIIQAK